MAIATTRRYAIVLLASACTACSVWGAPDTTVGELPVTNADVEESPFDTPEAMTEASELVIAGEVVEIESIGAPPDPVGRPTEYFAVSVRPDEVLRGDAPNVVTIGWEGFVTDGAGNRTLRITHNGVGMPAVGDRLLLFLVPETQERRVLLGSELTHRLNTLDGILFVDDGGSLSTPLIGEDRPAHELAGSTLADVESRLSP